ncbi:MAG: hypothetical protein GYA24_08980 [Candidatus Lokiarchaeota archaeon]|nr:hypothetical protein [Candidatus Lokiarchaeota archaeon]
MLTGTDVIPFIMELAAVLLDYSLGIALLQRISRLAQDSARRYYKGLFGFFITHSICRTIFLSRSYFVDVAFIEARRVLFDIGTILGLACVVLIVLAIETTIFPRSRKFFSIAGTCALGVMVVDAFIRITIPPYRLMIWMHYCTTPVLATFIILIYLRAFLKATGTIKLNALLMLAAIVLLSLSELANSTLSVILLGGAATILAPTIMATSLILLYYAVVHLSIWNKTTTGSTIASSSSDT